MRKKTADDEKREAWKEMCEIVDGMNEAVRFLRDKQVPVEIGVEDDGNLWIKVDGVLIEDAKPGA